MNTKHPSKGRGVKSKSKLNENGKAYECHCEDNLKHSRKLCSTTHNTRSAACLLDKEVTKKHRQSRLEDYKSSAEKRRRSDSEDSESSKEEARNARRSNQNSRSRKKRVDENTEYICEACKFDSREEIFLKYKTEVLKTSFLKEQLTKVKQKFRNLKAQQTDTRVLPESRSRSKLFLPLPIMQLSNRQRSLFVQSELSRLRSLIEDGQSSERIGQSLNAILIQLKEHIQDLQDSSGNKFRQQAKIDRTVKDYQSLLDKANEEVKNLKSKLKKVVRDNVELQDQYEDQKQQLKMLKAMVDNEKEHVRGTDHNFDKLHKEYTKLIAEHEAILAKQDQVKHSNAKLVELRTQLEAQFQKNLQELELANQEINFMKIQSEKQKHKKVEYEQLCERLQEQLRQLRQKSNLEKEKLSRSKHKLEQQYISKSQELAQAEKLQQKTIALIRDNDQLRKEVEYKTVQNNQAFAKIQAQEKAIVARQDQCKKLLKQNAVLIADLTNCRQQIEVLREDITQLKRTTENYKNRQLMKSKKSLFEEQGVGHIQRGASQHKSSDSRDGKLKALADIQTLIRRHRQQLD